MTVELTISVVTPRRQNWYCGVDMVGCIRLQSYIDISLIPETPSWPSWTERSVETARWATSLRWFTENYPTPCVTTMSKLLDIPSSGRSQLLTNLVVRAALPLVTGSLVMPIISPVVKDPRVLWKVTEIIFSRRDNWFKLRSKTQWSKVCSRFSACHIYTELSVRFRSYICVYFVQ